MRFVIWLGDKNSDEGFFQETIKVQTTAIDLASKSLAKSFQRFLKEDVKQMRDTRGYFNKISNDLGKNRLWFF